MRQHKTSFSPMHPVASHVGANVTPQHAMPASGSSTPVHAGMPDSVDQAAPDPGMAPSAGDGMAPDMKAGPAWGGKKRRY